MEKVWIAGGVVIAVLILVSGDACTSVPRNACDCGCDLPVNDCDLIYQCNDCGDDCSLADKKCMVEKRVCMENYNQSLQSAVDVCKQKKEHCQCTTCNCARPCGDTCCGQGEACTENGCTKCIPAPDSYVVTSTQEREGQLCSPTCQLQHFTNTIKQYPRLDLYHHELIHEESQTKIAEKWSLGSEILCERNYVEETEQGACDGCCPSCPT